MASCCGKKPPETTNCDPCNPPVPSCNGTSPVAAKAPASLAWFEDMVSHCFDDASAAKQEGRPIVGIMCEYTPRELIMAAGGLPVCLCGGSADMIPAAEDDLPANLCPLI